MNKDTSLAIWLERLEQLHPNEIELGLDRIRTVANKLGLINTLPTVVTIAGTNGKGSTVAMLEAACSALSLSCGCYTSPHLLRFNERIRLNGAEARDAQIVAAFEKIEQSRGSVSLTYFEFTTLAALVIFAQQELDVVILEVGLGGRLDAVNIVDADIAVVTSIALDHQDWLGNTLDEIAVEKLGIARAEKPLVIADPNPCAALLQAQQTTGAIVYRVGEDYSVDIQEDKIELRLVSGSTWRLPIPDTLSVESYTTAIQVLDLLGYELDEVILRQLAATQLGGRFQRITVGNTELVFDVAHNEAAISRLSARVANEYLGRKVDIWFGMLADKDINTAINILKPVVTGDWYLAELDHPRALPSFDIQSALSVQGCDGVKYDLGALCERNNPPEVLLICGSFYTVAAGILSLQRKGFSW